jgi:hypothetical protein
VSDADASTSSQPARRPRSLTEWLRSRSDEQLTELLALRPDLALPVPADLGVVANRATTPSSVSHALDTLDTFVLAVLGTLIASPSTPSYADLAGHVGERATDRQLRAAVDRLQAAALVWGGDSALHVAGNVRAALSPSAPQLGRPVRELLRGYYTAADLAALDGAASAGTAEPHADAIAERFDDPAAVAALAAECSTSERGVLEQLSRGIPRGTFANARTLLHDRTSTSPIAVLLHRGLLIATEPGVVELPLEVGLALAGPVDQPNVSATPPTLDVTQLDPQEVDAAGAGQAAAVIRLAESLLNWYGLGGIRRLRSGGLGVRELKRTARVLQTTEAEAALLVETLHAARLLDSTRGNEAEWLPTDEFDRWSAKPPAERWRTLASAWLAMPRMTSLIGQRDEEDKPINALGYEVNRSAIPHTRRTVLSVLARLPAGAAASPAEIVRSLRWHAPRMSGPYLDDAVPSVLSEAAALGVLGRGALTGYGRQLLVGHDPGKQLGPLLPAPVDHFLVQADLTVVAPGPLTAELANQMTLVADVESSGGATVYRVSDTTILRAMDAGYGAAELHELFRTRSRTPIPQALTYLIDDVARRHGALRVGSASAYLRSDDPALLAELLADPKLAGLGLRRIADTVLLTTTPKDFAVVLLRERGYTPVAESADGGVELQQPERRRVPAGRSRYFPQTQDEPGFTPAQLDELVRQLRAGDTIAGRARAVARSAGVPGVTTATTLSVLQQAIRTGAAIAIEYVDALGRSTATIVDPIELAGGTLRGHDHRRGENASFALYRITSAAVLDE